MILWAQTEERPVVFMVLPFVGIERVEKAKGEIWQETEDSEQCHHSWIQFDGSKTHAVCVLSAVAVPMSYQHNHLHDVASHARRPGS